jgi:hypothetical protein
MSPSGDENAADSNDPNRYEMDESTKDSLLPSWMVEQRGQERVAVIRTTDRIVYRRCRRRWNWSSHLRQNLGMREGASPLWMGSGFHFALEDYHGLNLFKDPALAFDAYAEATKRYDPRGLPPNYVEDWQLARGMLDYYGRHWLHNRDPLQTLIWNGVPQVEVNFRVDLPIPKERLKEWGYDRAEYSGTLDRVCVDEWGNLWIVEYKTAKAIQTLHLSNDSQVSSYCWAGPYIYGQPIVGVIYQQHRKDLPRPPKILASGQLSAAKDQLTTRPQLREFLINQYGSVNNSPGKFIDLLNHLAKEETPMKDKFVARNKIERNEQQCQAEGEKIMMEAEEMLNPNTPLYPNPTRDCQFMCSFNGPCVSMDDGSDWEYELSLITKEREPKYDTWRNFIKYPGTEFSPTIEGTVNNG